MYPDTKMSCDVPSPSGRRRFKGRKAVLLVFSSCGTFSCAFWPAGWIPCDETANAVCILVNAGFFEGAIQRSDLSSFVFWLFEGGSRE